MSSMREQTAEIYALEFRKHLNALVSAIYLDIANIDEEGIGDTAQQWDQKFPAILQAARGLARIRAELKEQHRWDDVSKKIPPVYDVLQDFISFIPDSATFGMLDLLEKLDSLLAAEQKLLQLYETVVVGQFSRKRQILRIAGEAIVKNQFRSVRSQSSPAFPGSVNQAPVQASPATSWRAKSPGQSPALSLWLEKMQHIQQSLAVTSDYNQKFSLEHSYREAHRKALEFLDPSQAGEFLAAYPVPN